MTRGNPILSTFVLLSLLMSGPRGAAQSQNNPSAGDSRKTFTISGTVGVPGVKFKSLPGDPVSDDHGRFSIEVPSDLNGYVMPIKEGYAFNPPFVAFGPASRIDTVHFTPRVLTFTISGNAGAPGVALQGFPQEVVSDSQGKYQAQVDYGWSGTVTPEKEGYRFEPPSRTFSSVTQDLTNMDFTPSVRQVTISSVVMADGEPLEGVRIVAEPGGYSAKTDAQGRYRIEVPYGWSGELVFEETYDPDKGRIPYTHVTSDIIHGPRVRGRSVTISNVIRAGNEPIRGVMVIARPGEYAAITDSRGRYRIQVPYGWSGGLLVSKEGGNLRTEAGYSDVTTDIIDGKPVPAGEERPADQPGASQGGVSVPARDVLVIPTGDAVPEKIAETTEDLRVMLQILREKLSEPRMIRGVLRDYGSLLGEDRRAEAIYLQGSAALFVIGADFPPSSPAQQPGQGEPPSRSQGEAADPVWQRARQKLYSPGSRTPSPSGQMQTMTFEQFQEELLRSLKHAANIRHIDPNELVVLTLVARNEDASRTGDADMMRQYENIYGNDVRAMMGAGHPAPATTVLTMQARKADVDAFAQGALDFDRFRQKVRSFTY